MFECLQDAGCCRVLLQYGADPSLPDNAGHPPAHLAPPKLASLVNGEAQSPSSSSSVVVVAGEASTSKVWYRHL